jgi:hypothetical protein
LLTKHRAGQTVSGLVVKLHAWPSRGIDGADGADRMIYRGVEYTVAVSLEPDVWQWWFQIGNIVSTGKTKTKLAEMAARRTQTKINVALRRIEIPISYAA